MEPPPLTALGLLFPALLLALAVTGAALASDCRVDARQICRDRGGRVVEVPAGAWTGFRCPDPEETP